MKRVTFTDNDGKVCVVLLRDEDDPNFPEVGIPVEPPPIERVVRDAAMEVQNEFVKRGMLTWRDVVVTQDGVSSVLRDTLRKKIIEAYKFKELEDNEQ